LATEDEQSLREWFDVLLQTRNFAKTAQQLLEIWKNDENLNTIPEIRQLKENKLNIKLDDDQNENDEETTVDDSSELERTQNEILDIVVQDVEGNPIKFRDVVAEQVTLLVLLRQFGCSVCRQQFGRLVKFQHLFEDLGVRLVAIGNGTPRMAKAFKTEFGFSGPLYVDTPRKLYRALNTRRGLRFFMGPGGALAFFQAKKEGFTSADEILGDPFQLGGMFLWKDEVGFFYQFVQKFAGDFAPFDEYLLS
jgi:peroxiredoxin